MKLKEVLEKMYRADKVTVQENGSMLFCGDVNKCRFKKELLEREVDTLHPEMFLGLSINLKKEERHA